MANGSATPYLILAGGALLLGGGVAYAVYVSRRQQFAGMPAVPALPAAPAGNPGIVPPPYGSPVPATGEQPGPSAEDTRRLAEAHDAQRSVEELRRRAEGLPPLDRIPGVNVPLGGGPNAGDTGRAARVVLGLVSTAQASDGQECSPAAT